MTGFCHGSKHCLSPHRTPDSPYQRIYRVLHGSGSVSISTLFMAGYIPGILMGVGSMVVAFIYAKKHKYPVSGRTPMKEAVKVTLEAIPSLLLIIIVIGGIVEESSLPLRAQVSACFTA